MHGEDAEDHNLPVMVWYGVEPLVADNPVQAIELALKTEIPTLRRFILRRAAAQNDTLPAVVAALGATKDIELQRLMMEEMMASFEGRVAIPMPDAWKGTYAALIKSEHQDVRDRANQLAVLFGDQRVFGPMRALLADPRQDIARRQQALAVLVKGQDKDTADVLLSDAVLTNPELNDLLKAHWGEIRESSADRKAQVAAWKKELTPKLLAKANVGNGRRIFLKTCQNCHLLFGTGGQIGPDITGSNRANLDYILENMLDPSAVVGRDYQMTVVALKDGRSISGLLKQESDSALTIQTINDKVVVPKSEIEERSLSSVSMMPERQLDPMTKEEVRDLIAYLGSPNQVVLAGPSSPIDTKSGKVPGAIEGESMKIVEKTGGTAASQNMGGFKADRWSGADHLWRTGAKPGDKLTLEIPVEQDGIFDVEIVLTRARDYGIVKLAIDDTVLDAALDLYNGTDVITTGVLTYPGVLLKMGNHRLNLEITGANPDAVKGFMVAVDYLRLVPSEK